MSEGRCEIRLTRRYRAAPPDVWRALTEPSSLARWFGARRMPASVRTSQPERLLELDWRPPGEEPSLVRFEVSPDGEGTLLVLEHRLLDERLGMRLLQRWVETLARFEQALA